MPPAQMWRGHRCGLGGGDSSPSYTSILSQLVGCRLKTLAVLVVSGAGAFVWSMERDPRKREVQFLIDVFTHNDAMCDVCIQAEHKQKFIRTKVKRATTPFELVHSDVCGPFATPTGGSSCCHYFILFIDNHTWWASAWPLLNKRADTCTSACQTFQKIVEAIGYSIKLFRCDNERGEYDSKLQNAISKERSFIRSMSSLYTPQERRCRMHDRHNTGEGQGHANRLASPSSLLGRGSTHSG